MSIYGGFARVYDIFMKDVPYDDWVAYVIRLWEKYGKRPGLVLELGCGTGNVTCRLADKGYDMIGVDISDEMLLVAKEKNGSILFLEQDMREFELYGTVDSIICLCDSINYILEDDELVAVFKLAANYLNPGGLFIFDINTKYKFETVLGDNSFSQIDEDEAYIWENYYYEDERINEYNTTFFVKNKENGLFERFDEQHHERAYTTAEIKKALKTSGLVFVDAYDELSFDLPKKTSERIYFVAAKEG